MSLIDKKSGTQKNNALTAGDIFYIEVVEGKFVFGKVLFDVDKQYRKRKHLQKDGPYASTSLKGWYVGCLLVEMYKEVGESSEINIKEVLIQSALCTTIGLKDKNWGIIDNQKVDFTDISFPETLLSSNDTICIDTGELKIKTTLTREEYEKIGISTSRIDITSIADICLNMQGMSDLLKEEYEKEASLTRYDLRYHPILRNKLFKELNLDPDKSYYETSKEMGYDFERFFV